MGSLFHYFTQITHLENGDITICIDYNQHISKFGRIHWCKWFYEVPFPLFHTNHRLGKRGSHHLNGLQPTIFEICTNQLMQMVLWGPFSIISHKSPPSKTWTTKFASITSNQFRKFHETIEAMGFMRSFFHFFTQITPLENGDHTVWMDYKQQN